MTFISKLENTQNSFSCGAPFGPFWSLKYLNFDQKLPIWTAHHTFLESRHPEFSESIYYTLSTRRSQISIFLGSSSGTNIADKLVLRSPSLASLERSLPKGSFWYLKNSAWLSVFIQLENYNKNLEHAPPCLPKIVTASNFDCNWKKKPSIVGNPLAPAFICFIWLSFKYSAIEERNLQHNFHICSTWMIFFLTLFLMKDKILLQLKKINFMYIFIFCFIKKKYIKSDIFFFTSYSHHAESK